MLPQLTAIHHGKVFGRSIICADLETCASYTRSHGVSAITLDGDRVDRKGSLTGGYHDVRRSRLDAIKAVKAWTNKFEAESARHSEVQAAIIQLEQEISVNLGRIQIIDSQRKAFINDRQPLVAQAGWIQKEEEQAGVRLARLERALSDSEREEQSIRTRVEAMRAEVKSAFTQTLTNAEVRTLRDLNAQLTTQQGEFAEISQQRSEVSKYSARSLSCSS
jgi:structural maintenance of chromosome 3 (chondroitin sulfate proteoglycan 6)